MIAEKLAFDYFQEAIFSENRHDLNLARKYYLQFYHTISTSNQKISTGFDWIRVASFFYDDSEYEKALYFAKQSILSGSNECLAIYLYCCENLVDPIEYLEWAMPYITLNPFFEHSGRFFGLLNQYVDSYQVLYEVFEKVEEQFFIGSTVSAHQYVEYLRLMIDLEIKEGNMPQARYYLRKWLLIDSALVKSINEMIVYALFLDDLAYFWKRKDTLALLEKVEVETQLFYQIAKQSQLEPKVSDDLEAMFKSYAFKNPMLAKKKPVYEKWLKVLKGESVESIPNSNDWTECKTYLVSKGISALPHFQSKFTQFADLEEAILLYQVYMGNIQTKTEPVTDVSVTILGGGNQIGGSSIVVTIGDSHMMIDAGAFVNSIENQPLDLSPLHERGISLNNIDGLVITHAHMDHIGNVPMVHGLCETLPIYATEETKNLMWLMLKEQEKYDPALKRNGLVDKSMTTIQTMTDFFTIKTAKGDWNVQLFASGHIRGAVSVLLEKDGKSVFVTGDYSIQDQRTVRGLRIPNHIEADIVITESTYGFYPTSASIVRSRQEKMFIQQLLSVINNGGTVLIPAFALGRAQEIISIIRHYLPELHFPVYIDGMVCEITEVYERSIKNDNLQVKSLIGNGVTTAHKSYRHIGFDQFLNNIANKGKCCVIASSGMLYEGTKSMAYAKKIIDNPMHAIVFTGYLDEESPGFLVSQSTSSILLDGERKEIKASVLSLRLSAHANREEIVQTVLSLKPKHVILVHGDPNRTYRPSKMVDQPYPSIAELIKSTNINVIQGVNGETYHFRKEDFI